jgi:hypothetical protein
MAAEVNSFARRLRILRILKKSLQERRHVGCPQKWISGILCKSEYFGISSYFCGIPQNFTELQVQNSWEKPTQNFERNTNKCKEIIQKKLQYFLSSSEYHYFGNIVHGDMETWGHGNIETWTWRHGDMGYMETLETRRHGYMETLETWKHGDIDT